MGIQASELILNPDGSIYHLNLLPENLADTVITVGDQDRVGKITRHFDSIEIKVRKREFHTHTGTYKGKRITVISTGIGPDNIDIVLNELDALANIDFETRLIKEELKSLEIVRIGTTGSIQENIPVNAFLLSELGVGFDGLLHFYDSAYIQEMEFTGALKAHLIKPSDNADPYVISADKGLSELLHAPEVHKGITATNIGFYGPQGRSLRLKLRDPEINAKLASFEFKNKRITNLEMETSAIYGLAKLLGHKALSMNAVLANRPAGEFSENPQKVVDNLIEFSLDKLVR